MQIRGYKIRLPLDVLLVASANPDDYTNRGRIITPLKDRFGSQIRTHYPLDVDDRGGDHAPGGAARRRSATCTCTMPDYMEEIVATFSPPRPPVEPREPALRRVGAALGLQPRGAGGQRRAPGAARRRDGGRAPGLRPRGARRVDVRQDRDRDARGGPRGPDRRQHAQGARCSPCSRSACRPSGCATSSRAFDEGVVAHTGEDVAVRAGGRAASTSVPALREPVASLTGGDESPAAVAAAVEFVLEGLHLSKRLNKDASGARATYRSRG